MANTALCIINKEAETWVSVKTKEIFSINTQVAQNARRGKVL